MLGTHRLSIHLRDLRASCGRSRRALRLARGRITSLRGERRIDERTLDTSYDTVGHLLGDRSTFGPSLSASLSQVRCVLIHRRRRLTLLRGRGSSHISQLGTFNVRSMNRRRGGLLRRRSHLRRTLRTDVLLGRLHRGRGMVSSRLSALARRLITGRRRATSLRQLCRGTHVTVKGSMITLHRSLQRNRTYPIYNDLSRPCKRSERVTSALCRSVRGRCHVTISTRGLLGSHYVTLRHSIHGVVTRRGARRRMLTTCSRARHAPRRFSAYLGALQRHLRRLRSEVGRCRRLCTR